MSKPIASNKKAHRDYSILETTECGIELKGSEVKSLRLGKMSLDDSFARVERNEVILYNTHISPYEQASYLNVEPTRPRKLLLHRNQIRKLTGQVTQKGFTLVPLKAYFNEGGFAKIELAVCRGKKLYDRREDMKRRETEMEMRRVLKSGRKSKL
ncbi:MAG: SsrA-binding protein SmpB [Candidatus Omnitrophica bacterium]|nr:SsrA-binding protein SmpB [Candidatus Omnitrophota bacterium]MDD5592808.1 SsrA-binding protein SmpB [Candidatus Omnitrophota bacterium]